jgi:hypothetical protein
MDAAQLVNQQIRFIIHRYETEPWGFQLDGHFTPVLANYFGLVTPDGPEGNVMLITLPLWFLSLRTIWWAKLFERFLAINR